MSHVLEKVYQIWRGWDSKCSQNPGIAKIGLTLIFHLGNPSASLIKTTPSWARMVSDMNDNNDYDNDDGDGFP